MRLKNKYNRNRAYRVKHWKRIRNTEHPYRTFCQYNRFGLDVGYWHNGKFHSYDADAQIRRNFEWIDQQARYLESGTHKKLNASSWVRRQCNSDFRAQERAALNRVRQGDEDALFPVNKRRSCSLFWYWD